MKSHKTLKIFDIVQLQCRDGRLEGGAYESLDEYVNINGIPIPRPMEDVQGFPHTSYKEIYADTQKRKDELIKEFRAAVLRGC